MEGAVRRTGVERRRGRRHETTEAHGVQSTQVRPGHHAMLINISADGALIETGHRLLPGSNVDLVLERSPHRSSVRGRVLRCTIVRLQPASICYRGAIGFDRSLPWFVDHERVDTTQQVV
jgi:hypothetical protein